jgi:mRNA interferase MazF
MTGNFPKRGEVYWVSLDPAIGAETRKTRPCLIISNDKGNEASGTVIIAPITSKVKRVYSFEVETFIADRKGKIMVNQCRTIDKTRLGKLECQLDGETMNGVDEAIRITFGIA